MAAIKCPIHGEQIASSFCEHAAAAINARQPVQVFLQRDPWGWYTVCCCCARLPKEEHEADDLVCGKCMLEWASTTGSDYVQRCQNPVEESPEDDSESQSEPP